MANLLLYKAVNKWLNKCHVSKFQKNLIDNNNLGFISSKLKKTYKLQLTLIQVK